MTLFDTHTHLYLPEFEEDGRGNAVRRAVEAGVVTMMLPNVDLTTIAPLKELHAEFPDNTMMAMGLHPTEVKADWHPDLEVVRRELYDNPGLYKAVGEIGIDLYWDKTFALEQTEVFYQQCLWALDLDLPIIIHCREGLDETLAVLKGLPAVPRGVFHSFGGTAEDVRKIRETGDFYFGINGIVTFKKSALPAVLPEIPADRLLLETDSPYLAPVPHRGKRNESAFVVNTAEKVAESLGITLDRIAEITTENAVRLFGNK